LQTGNIQMILSFGHGDIDIAGGKRRVEISVRVVFIPIERPTVAHVDAEGGNGVVTLGESGRPVALVGIDIDYPGGTDKPFSLQFADGNHNIVDHTEAGAIYVLGMVHAACEGKTKIFVQCQPAALNRTANDAQNPVEKLD